MDETFVGKTGSEIFRDVLLRHVGYAGGAILPILDTIYSSRSFDFIISRHEQGAGHMAEGYARASGRPGIVLVTSGPGATNMITPLQDALSDGVPMIVFTGQVATTAIGSDAFQEADVVGMSRACTKWSVMVSNIDELPSCINKAFQIATSGRLGPVLIDLPKDVTSGVLQRVIPPDPILPRLPAVTSNTDAESGNEQLERDFLERISNLVNKAEKPIIYAGQGTICSSGGPEMLKELADKCSIPVTTTLLGLGAYDELDIKSLHMLGMHGTAYANMAMQEADLIIALGARFDDRVTLSIDKFAPGARAAADEGRGGILHFEIMPKNINKVIQVTEAVEGDIATNLKQLLPLLETRTIESRKSWFDKIDSWKKKWPLSNFQRSAHSDPIKPQALIEELSKLTDGRKNEICVTTGIGQHQMWAAQHFRWRYPRSMITSGGLGTMGYGLPAAIGAKIAKPKALVIDIDGDASFNMTLTELSTVAQFNIGVKIIILNNDNQGMVTQWQDFFYEGRHAYSHQTNPDFMKLANAMHIQNRRVEKPAEVVDALKWLINADGPALLEVLIDKEASVSPIVPTGSGLHEFQISGEGKHQK